MRFREKKRIDYDLDHGKDKPPEFVGLRDRIAHFTWCV
jgi:hypothetical protein